jgi:hypothetical protein
VRCQPVCLGTIDVYRRTCCCWPIVIVDDPRIPELIRDLEIIVDGLPRPPKGPIPPPPPDPFTTPVFKGGGLNEMALNAPADLAALRSLRGELAVQYVNSRMYLLRHICSCSRPVKVATGNLLPNGTFNICWIERFHPQRPNCHDEYAYVVKQTIGGATTTIYDGVAAGAWYHAGDHPVLTTYRPDAYSCNDTGTGDGTAFVYLDQVDDINAYELNTPDSTSWNSVDAPDDESGLMFPNPVGAHHLRNLGGDLELTYLFSEEMKQPAILPHQRQQSRRQRQPHRTEALLRGRHRVRRLRRHAGMAQGCGDGHRRRCRARTARSTDREHDPVPLQDSISVGCGLDRLGAISRAHQHEVLAPQRAG